MPGSAAGVWYNSNIVIQWEPVKVSPTVKVYAMGEPAKGQSSLRLGS